MFPFETNLEEEGVLLGQNTKRKRTLLSGSYEAQKKPGAWLDAGQRSVVKKPALNLRLGAGSHFSRQLAWCCEPGLDNSKSILACVPLFSLRL